MGEINPHIFGTIAAFLTTICFIPQAIKIVKYRHTEGISIWMYALFTTGVFFWLVYGYLLNSTPMVIANTITFLLALFILITLVKERGK